MAKHHLTVVEKKSVTRIIQDDQDNTDSTTANDGDTYETKIIRWNFPTLGKEYIDILTNFIENNDREQRINEVCRKEPSFASFWFENQFFAHHKKAPQIAAHYLDSGGKTTEVKFERFEVAKIDLSHGTLQEGTSYELKTAHPIVDCVGCLKGESLQKWLAFIQISLQSYEQHKQLSQLFCCNTGNPDNKSWSLYTYYRHLYNIDYNDSTTLVLLLYVLPSQSKLESLKTSITNVKINQRLYVGRLTSGTSFHDAMMQFEKMRKQS